MQRCNGRPRAWRAAIAVGGAALAVMVGASVQRTAAQALGAPGSLRAEAAKRTGSLKTVTVPLPANFNEFVADRVALRKLGKALFWDAQVGSDGQACASCHFHAGADNRSKNQLNPGFRNQTAAFPVGDTTFGNSPLTPLATPPFGPNFQLGVADFPLHRLADPADRGSLLLSDTNDVVSSQGVFNAAFRATGIPFDSGTASLLGPGASFHVGADLVRNVEPRNTPTVVNAIFNQRNFWDSRGRGEFNGVNPIGLLDPTARVVAAGANAFGVPNARLESVRIHFMSTASQADGPPTSNLEMSFDGRRNSDLGRKLLDPTLIALGLQVVAADDSVLGAASNQRLHLNGGRGIALRYADLVKLAIQPRWWNAPAFRVDLSGAAPAVVRTNALGPNLFTVMEYNFSLYFGLAIAEYERSLVADDSPFDRFMDGSDTALSPTAQRGLSLFLGQGRCVNCHGGAELTNASVSNVQGDQVLERMIMGDDRVAVYDDGHYNIGVRPTLEDIGVGGRIGPLDLPLANTRRYQECVQDKVRRGTSVFFANLICDVPRIRARPLEAQILLEKALALLGSPAGAAALLADARANLELPSPTRLQLLAAFAQQRQARHALGIDAGATAQVRDLLAQATSLMPDPATGGDLNPFKPKGPLLRPEERIAVNGALKVPGLRNVELTAPYFHNGGQGTLDQVVEFYDRGGDFAVANEDDLDPDIAPIGFTAEDRGDLVAFLKSLTDERVRFERAPFDHPSLDVPNGGTPGVITTVFGFPVLDDRVIVPAVGALGSAAPLGTPNAPSANFPDPLR